MNDTKELKSEYVALGRGSWEGITNSSLLHAARCGLLLQDTGKGPRKQAEPGSVRTLVTSSSWRLSPAFLASLVASDKSSFQPGRLPAAPKENQVRAGGKSTLTNYLPHSPPRSEPSPPRARSPSRRSSGKWALAGGRARSPADARQRKRAASGGRRPPGRLRGARTGSAGRMEEGRRAGEVGGGPSPARAHPALGTLAARRPRVRSACAAAPRRKSRRLAAGDWGERSGNFAREMLPTLQPAEEDKNVRR